MSFAKINLVLADSVLSLRPTCEMYASRMETASLRHLVFADRPTVDELYSKISKDAALV